jgi:hypothetical protein
MIPPTRLLALSDEDPLDWLAHVKHLNAESPLPLVRVAHGPLTDLSSTGSIGLDTFTLPLHHFRPLTTLTILHTPLNQRDLSY